MRIFLDTSTLIPLFYGDHPHHDASVRIMEGLAEHTGFCGAPNLVEAYSTLTRMPGKYRVSAEKARLFIADLRDKLQAITLTAAEYFDVIDTCASAGIAGGSIYDAVHARCALKAGAEVLLTWNLAHFIRFPEVAGLVRSPENFPVIK